MGIFRPHWCQTNVMEDVPFDTCRCNSLHIVAVLLQSGDQKNVAGICGIDRRCWRRGHFVAVLWSEYIGILSFYILMPFDERAHFVYPNNRI